MNLALSFSPEAYVGGGVGLVVFLVIVFFVIRKLVKRKKPYKFREEWRKLQKKLPNQGSWGEAIIEADKLLNDALTKRKLKGKTTGEMLVKAEKTFSDKDEVWFSHKLAKKIQKNPGLKLNKKTVVRALVGLRQAIKDLGAFDGKK